MRLSNSLGLVGFAGLVLLSSCAPAQPPMMSPGVATQPPVAAAVALPTTAALPPAAAPPAEAAAPAAESTPEARRVAGKLTIYVIDVGQGDSTVVVGPEENGASKVLIIDGGPSGSGAMLMQFFADSHLDHVDYAVVTHFDADHVGGFVMIGGNKPLFWSGASCDRTALFPKAGIYDHFAKTPTSQSAGEWRTCVKGSSLHAQVGKDAGRGDTMDLGGAYTAKIIAGDGYVLGQDTQVPHVNTENARSVVVLIAGPGGFEMLIPGDASGQPSGQEKAEVEVAVGEYLNRNGIDLEVLRVGHHGSANTTNPKLLELTNPEVAVISVGDMQPANFKHPRCKTYETLASGGVKVVLQTETGKPDCANPTPAPVVANGSIRIDVQGGEYSISSVPPSPAVAFKCTKIGCTGGDTPTECCRICRTSKACGDSCISVTSTCTKPKGCACNGE